MDKNVEETACLFLIQKENGRRLVSRTVAFGSERLLYAVSVVKRPDGTGTVSFPRSDEKPLTVRIGTATAEEFARKLLADEETEYGTPRTS